VTKDRRWRPFSAGWSATLDLLDREIRNLRGRSVIIAAGFREQDVRLDGWPRSGIPEPPHPGVELSFDSMHGRLVYVTDTCSHWQDNVRSLALGLESLRAVDRFGISRRGEQYAGWRALPAGSPGRPATLEDAWALFEKISHRLRDDIVFIGVDAIWRDVAKATHPDTGGDAETFVQAQAAYELLKARA
jgi:hypothetical protein